MNDVKPPEQKPVPEVPDAVKETMTASNEPEPAEAPAMSEPPAETNSESADTATQSLSPLPEVTESVPSPVKPANKSNNLKIIVAVVVALVLIAAAVYVYMTSNSTDSAATKTDTTTTQTTQTTPATVSDVDQTVSDVDEAITAADAAQDVSSEDLSDTALGL
jgi:uncharacterized protein HemX